MKKLLGLQKTLIAVAYETADPSPLTQCLCEDHRLLYLQPVAGRPPRPGGKTGPGPAPGYIQPRDDFAAMEAFQAQFMSLNETQRMLAGHQLDDMLIDCSWKGRTCGPE